MQEVSRLQTVPAVKKYPSATTSYYYLPLWKGVSCTLSWMIYQLPSQKRRLPHAILIQRCCPMLQAITYKYFGENTVQMKRCVLNVAQASMTAKTLAVLNALTSDKCWVNVSCRPPLLSPSKSKFVAEVHQIGPAQFPQKVSSATNATS